jgi:hypothetical protein
MASEIHTGNRTIERKAILYLRSRKADTDGKRHSGKGSTPVV